MPDDVLEQFVLDHGTNESFQQQYADIDLHAVLWSRKRVAASKILSASRYPHFGNWIETVASRTRLVAERGWDDVCLPPDAVECWRTRGTWRVAPVMIRRDLIDGGEGLHLVEGHTRFGALRGLVDSRVVEPATCHEVWIGELGMPTVDDGAWREVLRDEHLPFLDWLRDQIGENGVEGEIARALIDARTNGLPSEGTDLEAALSYATNCPGVVPYRDAIVQAHVRWMKTRF